MDFLDKGTVTTGDFKDYLKSLVEFGQMIGDAADEEVLQNTHIKDIVTAKHRKRAAIREAALGNSPKVKLLKNVVAIKKKEESGWVVYDSSGKKRLGGPYSSEKEADKRLDQVEYFKSKSKEKEPEKRVEAKDRTESEIDSVSAYDLSRKVTAFVSWAMMKGGPRVRSYAQSINLGMTALARSVGSSLYAVHNRNEIGNSSSFGLRAVQEAKSRVETLLSLKITAKEKDHLLGLMNDLNLVEKIVKLRK